MKLDDGHKTGDKVKEYAGRAWEATKVVGNKALGVVEMSFGTFVMGVALAGEAAFITLGVPGGVGGVVFTGGAGLLVTAPTAIEGYTIWADGAQRVFGWQLPSFNVWEPYGFIP